ncbi:MAG: DMT family transporter [Chloroflexi bacterium]|nr:DMT family transporter [Chloroflexota bacterium]
MEIQGLVFALLAAMAYAAAVVFVRRGTHHAGEATTAVTISVFVGVIFFSITTSISGEWGALLSLSWRQVLLLSAAGIVHFVAGRLTGFAAYRLIGANKASPFTLTTPFYTLILGIVFLNESLTVYLIIGIVCIFIGALLVSTERKSVAAGETTGRFSGIEAKGIIYALGAALFWGISPILIRPVMREFGSASAAALVSYIAASIVMAGYLLANSNHRKQLSRLGFSATLLSLIAGGLGNSLAHLFNFTALSYGAASVVTPIISTNVLLTLLFSFLLNRNIELFTPKVVIGMVATVAGAFLISYF